MQDVSEEIHTLRLSLSAIAVLSVSPFWLGVEEGMSSKSDSRAKLVGDGPFVGRLKGWKVLNFKVQLRKRFSKCNTNVATATSNLVGRQQMETP